MNNALTRTGLLDSCFGIELRNAEAGDPEGLACLILLAPDASKYPPYRPTPAATLARLTGVSAGSTGDPGQRYEEFLAWLMRPGAGRTGAFGGGGVRLAAGDTPRRDRTGASLAAVKVAVEEGYTAQDYAQRKSLTNEYHAFLTLMHPDDVVVVQIGSDVKVGTIASDPEYREEVGYRLVRDVAWIATAAAAGLAAPLPSLLDLQGNVVEITQGLAGLREVIAVAEPPMPGEQTEMEPPVAVKPDVVPRLPAVTPDAAARLHTSQQALQEIVDLLQARQQIVLYGAPGTGKTYLALALARHSPHE